MVGPTEMVEVVDVITVGVDEDVVIVFVFVPTDTGVFKLLSEEAVDWVVDSNVGMVSVECVESNVSS